MTITATDTIVEEIRRAFPARRQGRFLQLVKNQNDESVRVIAAFEDKDDWTVLAPDWLDKVPRGLGSALSFMADEALCFYIPAYMIADMVSTLKMADPIFALIYGFYRMQRHKKVSPDEALLRARRTRLWSGLTKEQVLAIVHYLEWAAMRDRPYPGHFSDNEIVEALGTYWYDRVSQPHGD
jgi:hypothetical protein